MTRVISIKVPEGVSEEDVVRWVAERLSRKLSKRIILKYLEKGIDVDLEKVLREFEETRSEVWKRLEEEYRRKELL